MIAQFSKQFFSTLNDGRDNLAGDAVFISTDG